ncbi:uncharacterized protein LOC142329208 [Lycorma delicatula]|uniref:uncharacterized protein LOC142329208 n=1 Tax=Lycorma delicatula TaxID=130591 RepID=UPI003F511E21
MGLRDIKTMTNAADQNWRSYCDDEEKTRELWNSKWGWILIQCKKLNNSLTQLKLNRPVINKDIKQDKRTVRPFPETTSRDIGWLSAKPEFQLEVIGPYPYTRQSKPPILPPNENLDS